ncbi:arylesterase [Pseudaeromonas sp. ZJS20]|uniref:arylesterase n=1 Tax=Pseudaeromonas aegiceratis TaxID=3153928 RepID=UPI00390CB968
MLLVCLWGVLSIPAWGQGFSLLVLGDSLSAGYRMTAEQSWPRLLNAQPPLAAAPLTVINASVSGETTQGGLTRLPGLLQSHKPDWVLVELGANDGLRGLPVNQTQDNLAAIIAQSQAAGAQVVLMQIRLPRNYGRRFIDRFEGIYPALAQQYSIPLMPFLLEPLYDKPALLFEDGLHPRAEAQPLIATQVASFLAPLLTQAQVNRAS